MKALRTKTEKKLRSRLGETLAETLVSLLIGALALTMLAGAVSTAGKLVNKSRIKLDTYYSQRDVLTKMSESGTAGDTIFVTIADPSSTTSISQEEKVAFYSNREQIGGHTVAAYKIIIS